MDKVKIKEIAEEVGLSYGDLLGKVKELGFDVKEANSTISFDDAGILVDYAISGTLPKGFKIPHEKVKTKVIKKRNLLKERPKKKNKPSAKRKWKGITITPKGSDYKEYIQPKFDKFKELNDLIETYGYKPYFEVDDVRSIKKIRRIAGNLIEFRKRIRKLSKGDIDRNSLPEVYRDINYQIKSIKKELYNYDHQRGKYSRGFQWQGDDNSPRYNEYRSDEDMATNWGTNEMPMMSVGCPY